MGSKTTVSSPVAPQPPGPAQELTECYLAALRGLEAYRHASGLMTAGRTTEGLQHATRPEIAAMHSSPDPRTAKRLQPSEAPSQNGAFKDRLSGPAV